MFFDDEDEELKLALHLSCLSTDDNYSYESPGERDIRLLKQDSYGSVRREFFYQIFQWKSSWAFDKTYNDIPPKVIDSIPMDPVKLIYSSYHEYQKIFLPPILSEFWYTLRDDIAEEAKKKKKPRVIEGPIRENSHEFISVNDKSGDSNHRLTRFKMTAIVPCQINKLENKYPSRGDLVIIKYSKTGTEHFGYVEEGARNGNRWCSTTTLTFVLLTKLCSQSELSDSVTLTSVDWILSYLTHIDSLEYIPQSPLIESILKPDDHSFQLLPCITTIPTVTKETLNSKQLEILGRVIVTVESQTPGISLIQGPPGTGKSTVIKNIIASVLSRRGTRVLVCAPSNKAIDELVMRLLAIQPIMEDQGTPWDIVRVGREDKIHKSVKCVSLLNLRKSKYGSTREQVAEENILRNADIIACTLTSCYTSYRMKAVFGINGLKIPFCIIDEAAQATEMLTLVPLMFNINRLILVGDPQQLPPTVLSQKAKEYGYDQSLFARAQKKFQNDSQTINPIVMLDTQYRMVDAIAEWPNRYFYKGAIKNAASVTPLNFCNYKVLNHSYSQDSEGHSNPLEAILVAKLVKAMIEREKITKTDKEISIGVITPYKKQCVLINQLLNPPEVKKILQKKDAGDNDTDKKDGVDKENTDAEVKVNGRDDKNEEKKNDSQEKKTDTPKPNKIEVNTVDSFQGSECDVIIMSCVRSEGIGFVKDPHRLCVSLTRAKHSLILCGNFNTFKINETWENLLNDASSRGVYVDVSRDEIQAITNHIIVNRTNALF